MSDAIVASHDHGPEWASAVADLADKAAAAFARSGEQGCLSVVDLQPWRLLDAWWLRRRLEPLAKLSGRPLRYVPCLAPIPLPRDRHITAFAPAWSVGDAPVQLWWPTDSSTPRYTANGRAWLPDGAVLVLAGDLPARLPQELLLAHHGQINEWGGPPQERQWQAMDFDRHEPWVGESIRAYANGLPSSMLSLPIGYWRFMQRTIAWASRGCLVLARAEGWSSLAEIREDSVGPTRVKSDSPPVNFHWLAQHLPRLGASAHTVRACRDDAVQLVVSGLPDPDTKGMLPLVCAPLAAAASSDRAARARAIRTMAAGGDLDAALSIVQLSGQDPALLRAAWDALVPAAQSASPATSTWLGSWVERIMTDNPWIGDDPDLLRAVGHLALACNRVDLAQTALRALGETGRAQPADLAALACCLERLGRFEAALSACEHALARDPRDAGVLATRDRIAARQAALAQPWRVQHGAAESLMLDPLHPDHAPMLVRQMRDPSIAVMTALPALADGDDGRAWIEKLLEDGPSVYAIVHRQKGFVGYFQLRLWKSTAFVSYWIGSDYQGLGFCGQALALGCELAFRNGVDLLLSSAYDDNVRSLRALRKRGFQPMTVRAEPPDGDRTFLMLPAASMDALEARQRLIEFCENTGSGLRFAAHADVPPSKTGSAADPSGHRHS